MTPLKDINPLTPLTIRGSRPRPSRREAMQWVLAAAGASALPTATGSTRAFAQEEARRPILTQEDAAKQPDQHDGGAVGDQLGDDHRHEEDSRADDVRHDDGRRIERTETTLERHPNERGEIRRGIRHFSMSRRSMGNSPSRVH